jgi:hypothetical protein
MSIKWTNKGTDSTLPDARDYVGADGLRVRLPVIDQISANQALRA